MPTPSPTMKRAPKRAAAPAPVAEEQFHCQPDAPAPQPEPEFNCPPPCPKCHACHRGECAPVAAQPELSPEAGPTPAPAAKEPTTAKSDAAPALPVDHSERGHSKISPSKTKSLEICPRYRDEEGEPHPITLRGTAMHEAIDSGKDDGLDEEEVGMVAMCRGFIEDSTYEGCTLHHELRIPVLDGIWGFADLLILSGDRKGGHLLDWKFSTQLQEDAETNPAAQSYALGIFKMHPELEALRVSYLYPRLEQISETVFYREQMAQFEVRLKTIKARVEEGAPAFAQFDNCLYCANKATCSALHALALPIATRYATTHDELTIPAEYQPSEIREPKMMARAFEVALVMEKWVESVKHHAKELRFQTGAELEGFDFRTRAGSKKITSPEAAWAFGEARGLTLADFLTTIDVSARKLVDAVSAKAERGQKAKVAQAFEDTLRNEGVLEVGPDTTFFQRQKKVKADAPKALPA